MAKTIRNLIYDENNLLIGVLYKIVQNEQPTTTILSHLMKDWDHKNVLLWFKVSLMLKIKYNDVILLPHKHWYISKKDVEISSPVCLTKNWQHFHLELLVG